MSNVTEMAMATMSARMEAVATHAALKRGETKIASFLCLPDTVDPRAPKPQ